MNENLNINLNLEVREGENEVRRVLRLRLECCTALNDYLLGLESGEGGNEGKEFVKSLRGWNAKIAVEEVKKDELESRKEK